MSAFTDEKRRGYAEQQLPPAAGSGGAPAPQSSASHISPPGKAQKTHRYKQYCTIFAFGDQRIHAAEVSSETGRTYGTELLTSKQNPLEQNTCTGMQTELNQPFCFVFFNVTDIIQGAFSLE